jgi:hypothetical protein
MSRALPAMVTSHIAPRIRTAPFPLIRAMTDAIDGTRHHLHRLAMTTMRPPRRP